MSTDAAHSRWWQTFEAVFGLPLLLAIVLQLVVPLSFPQGLFTLLRFLVGAALVLVGALGVVATRREFTHYKQPTDPGLATSTLLTTGVFAYSRNPLYLAGVCLLVGIALVFNLVWELLLLVPALVACQFILILPEERYLAVKFGKDYAVYASSVNRWIGRTGARRE